MLFKILITDGRSEWWEDYDKDVRDPHEYASNIIENFNDTLRPNQKPRRLLRVEVQEDNNEKFHRWVKRTDGMSVSFRGRICDLMFCQRCGITGKRFGLSQHVKIDSRYSKKCFLECHTSIAELQKQHDSQLPDPETK